MNQPNTTPAVYDFAPRSLDQALDLANMLASSSLVPKDYQRSPGNILVAIQWGAEVGLKPLQAMQNIAVINGRPSLWGDAMLAIVRASPLCESVIETESDTKGTCTVKRRGEPEYTVEFTVEDAKKAGLYGKQGPWQTATRRMMKLRARAFALRDKFPDVLRGIGIKEIMEDDAEQPENRIVNMGKAEIARPPEPEKPVALPPYEADRFETNLAQWNGLIQSGKKSADQVIATLSTKAILSEDQIGRLRALEIPDEEVIESKMEADPEEITREDEQ